MARNFAAADNIEVSVGAIPQTSAFTWAAILRVDSLTAIRTIFGFTGGSGANRFALSTTGSVQATIDGTLLTLGPNVSVSDGWALVTVKKATGSATYSTRVYKYATGVTTGGPTSTSSFGSSTTFTAARIGSRENATTAFSGDIAALALFDYALANDQVDRLAFSLASWTALDPKAMWVLDQSNTSQAVHDITGNGADQIGLTATAVAVGSVPILSYGHPVIVSTRSAPSGGTTHNASATAAGTAGLSATATVDRAASGTAAGAGSVTGTAAVDRTASSTTAGTGAVTATGSVDRVATASATGTASLAASPLLELGGTSTTSGTGGLTGSTTADRVGTSTTAGTGALAGTASVDRTGSATTGGAATLSGTASVDRSATTTVAGTGILSASGTVSGTGASGDIIGVGNLSADAAIDSSQTATTAGAATVTAAPEVVRITLATVAGTAALAAAADIANGQAAGIAGTGGLTGDAQVIRAATATMGGTGGLAGSAGSTQDATATLAGQGAIAADATGIRRPGILTAGTTRSRLTASTLRGPTYTSGG